MSWLMSFDARLVANEIVSFRCQWNSTNPSRLTRSSNRRIWSRFSHLATHGNRSGSMTHGLVQSTAFCAVNASRCRSLVRSQRDVDRCQLGDVILHDRSCLWFQSWNTLVLIAVRAALSPSHEGDCAWVICSVDHVVLRSAGRSIVDELWQHILIPESA